VQAAIGGQVATQVLDGDRRFDVVVRFLPQYRESVEAIATIPVSTPDGSTVPLTSVADITKQTGASFIYREDNARYIPNPSCSLLKSMGFCLTLTVKSPISLQGEPAHGRQNYHDVLPM